MSNAPTIHAKTSSRLVSLDAYRGFVMICLAANGFGIVETSRHESLKESPVWQTLGYQFDHVPWVGCAFWDLIQPSFMFMVGVSLPYSYARRREEGDAYWRLLLHAIIRSIVLVLLGIFLSSAWEKSTSFTFMNVLSQIGLGYVFLFLLWGRSRGVQLSVAAAILVAYWAWFALTPVAGPDFDFVKVGVPKDWPFLTGFAAHWQKCANPAATFDLWFLNLFPKAKEFVFNRGGYQTLNFIPSLATMIFGLMAGEFIRSSTSRTKTLLALIGSGVALFAVGWAFDRFGVCPLVKRIWTPSWALYSTGLTLLMLSVFYGVIDVVGWRRWAFPLVVAGMNSIALYLMGQLLRNSTADALQRHFGQDLFTFKSPLSWLGMAPLNEAYIPLVKASLVLLTFWLFVYWLYRQRIFFRI